MAKGDGFKRDWRCKECGRHNPGWRPNCWESSCQVYRDRLPEDFPAPTLDDYAAAADYAERWGED